jgi:DNA-binding NtrC family response regulator
MAERARILVVDDDAAVVELIVETLRDRYTVDGVTSAREALARAAATDYDLVISDVEMPELRGTELLAEIIARKPKQLVLLITAFGSIELAVETVRAGACDFITKPFKSQVLIVAIERALRERTMRRELVRLRRELGEPDDGSLVATSAAMSGVLDVARRAARGITTVLITGESGTGKGALARWIHDRGPRAAGPFVRVLPVETDLSEALAEASGGTLFLDEISDLSADAQGKLLAVLESPRFDTRVIAATNRDIDALVAADRFRADLFFRLCVIRIAVPPLRDRADDIPALVSALLARATHGATTPHGITDEALRHLVRRDWPGNVRELANIVERAVALTEHDTIVLDDVRGQQPADPTNELLALAADRQLSLAEVERGYIRRILDANKGNVSRAARILGIDRRTLYRKLAGS